MEEAADETTPDLSSLELESLIQAGPLQKKGTEEKVEVPASRRTAEQILRGRDDCEAPDAKPVNVAVMFAEQGLNVHTVRDRARQRGSSQRVRHVAFVAVLFTLFYVRWRNRRASKHQA